MCSTKEPKSRRSMLPIREGGRRAWTGTFTPHFYNVVYIVVESRVSILSASEGGRRLGASIKDVARHAGVSVKTVANVINDFPFVSAATRAKVQQALKDLDYRPNLSARQLRGGRTGVVALAVPEISAPYFAELAAQFVQQAKGHNWTVLIDETQGDRGSERVVLDGIKSPLVDGLIVSPLALSAADIGARRDSTPLVLLGERLARAPIDHVSIDNVDGARTATAH